LRNQDVRDVYLGSDFRL